MHKITRLIIFFLLAGFHLQAFSQQFPLGNTIHLAGWYRLGTLSLTQQGNDAQITIVGGSGYNATNGQNGECQIHFRTSNNESNTNGFLASGYFSSTGSLKFIGAVRVVQLNNSTWDFYALLATYTGNGATLSLLAAGGNWTPGFMMASPPVGAVSSDLDEKLTYQSPVFYSYPVSIGVADPKGYKLAVGGGVVAESVNVKLQANWPDYVFDSGYQLPDLSEVENFISVNKHLPDIPSENEIKTSGIDVADINTRLLKKIEELTLYLVEQQKDIKSLRRELEVLKSKSK
ncbi:hypothetical protein GS399_05445 [Pedobacter sp. HMF7647]|uniref:Cell wall anchor protein n=1 Tax=Hufsiella arboris TaxID=2695275 RepID=A0A7K1Y7J3_9SPHI|nr:hypothetical protein [Hufsiella arboris]MXV50410.1 hypothetical protein [Hufsiella arboris]